jgi:arginyl-tRNA synthetase
MKRNIADILKKILSDMGVSDVEPYVKISDNPIHGDYTTNVAMLAAKSLKQNPLTIAKDVKKKFDDWKMSHTEKTSFPIHSAIDHIEVAPPGFINVFLTNTTLLCDVDDKKTLKRSSVPPTLKLQRTGKPVMTQKGKTIMVEFAHPNTHKSFHIGHLRNITTGESIVRLLEKAGNNVIRVNYQGDVGLHIAKAIYGLVKYIIDNKNNNSSQSFTQNDLKYVDQLIKQIESQPLAERIELLSKAYVIGHQAFEINLLSKTAINEVNKLIYSKVSSGIFSLYYSLYQKTRNWTLEYFDAIYKRVGSHFDRLYFESETYDLGKKLVLQYVEKGIFEKNDGAIIFPGEKFGLHNRVFITSEGNPTYEGKDIGLAKLQFDEFHPDQIIHVVASEQIEYFRVIFEAISQVFPETKGREHHLVYGWVRLKTGKMSSRSGNVVLGEWLLDEVKKPMQEILTKGDRGYDKKEQGDIAEKTSIGAVKYAFLKVSTPQEIAFDIKESINLNGDSGPYLLYTYARCKSVMGKNIIGKQKTESTRLPVGQGKQTLNQEERALARLLFYFPEIIASAGNNFAPNILCTYLFNLAQTFNILYAKHPILEHDLRLMLTEKTAETLKEGLRLLGIETVERM